MPAVTDDEPEVPHVFDVPPIVSKDYQSAVIDSNVNPLSSLLVYTEGSSWTTEFYSQVLGRDSQPGPQDLDRLPPYQQYKLISRFELKVTAPLTTSQDSTSLEFTVNGTATLYPSIIPNKGDMFIADVGDGRAGIFTITLVEKKTIMRDSCYSIEYQLVDYDNQDRLRDLAAKVVKKEFFEKEFLQHGQNPVITGTAQETFKQLQEHSRDLLDMYFQDFFDRKKLTFLVPDQLKETYDPFLAKVISKLFTSGDHADMRRLTIFNVEGDLAMSCETIWDVLLQLDPSALNRLVEKVAGLKYYHWDRRPQQRSFYYADIEEILYPAGPDNMVKGSKYFGPTTVPLSPLVAGKPRRLLAESISYSNGDLKRVTVDDLYVFSEAFYRGQTAEMSKLELTTYNLVNEIAIDKEVLNRLCLAAKDWESLERFYYVPILLLILRVSIRGI